MRGLGLASRRAVRASGLPGAVGGSGGRTGEPADPDPGPGGAPGEDHHGEVVGREPDAAKREQAAARPAHAPAGGER